MDIEKKSTKMEINKRGELIFPDIPFVLNPRLSTAEECSSALNKYMKETSSWSNYLSQDYSVLFEGLKAGIGLTFKDGKLIDMGIGVSLPTAKLIDKWPTKESSLEEIKFIKKAFKKQFGGKLKHARPYYYFDLRGYCATCGIDYDIKNEK